MDLGERLTPANTVATCRRNDVTRVENIERQLSSAGVFGVRPKYLGTVLMVSPCEIEQGSRAVSQMTYNKRLLRRSLRCLVVEISTCVGAKTLLPRFQNDYADLAFGLELVLDCLVEDLLCRIEDERLDLSFFVRIFSADLA